MHERIALTDKYAKEYQKATKKEKGKILDKDYLFLSVPILSFLYIITV